MADTKEYIIQTAAKLFMQDGYKGVTMQDLVKKSGLTRGAFYYYFKSKELLFKAVVDHVITTYQTLSMHYEGKTLKQLYYEYIDHFSTDITELDSLNFLRILFDAVKLFPEIEGEIATLQNRQRERWIEVITAAKKSGEIKTSMSNEHIANIFMYSADGLGLEYILTRKNTIKSAFLDLWNNFYESMKK
jgi:AcrR family transcriptional regulator